MMAEQFEQFFFKALLLVMLILLGNVLDAGSRDLLTLNLAYPSRYENHFRLGKVCRTHLVEFALRTLMNSPIVMVDGIDEYRWKKVPHLRCSVFVFFVYPGLTSGPTRCRPPGPRHF